MLTSKLERKRFEGWAIKWIRNCLGGCSQRVLAMVLYSGAGWRVVRSLTQAVLWFCVRYIFMLILSNVDMCLFFFLICLSKIQWTVIARNKAYRPYRVKGSFSCTQNICLNHFLQVFKNSLAIGTKYIFSIVTFCYFLVSSTEKHWKFTYSYLTNNPKSTLDSTNLYQHLCLTEKNWGSWMN